MDESFDLTSLTNMGIVGGLEEQTRSEAPDPVSGIMFPEILQESPPLTFTNTLLLTPPRRMRLTRAERLTPEEYMEQ